MTFGIALDERRLKAIYVEPGAALMFLQGRLRIVGWDLPADARVVSVDYAADHVCWRIFVASAQFDRVPIGEHIPALGPIEVQHNEQTSDIIERVKIVKAIDPALRCARCQNVLDNVSPGYSVTSSGEHVCAHCLRVGEEAARARTLMRYESASGRW